MNKQRVIYDVLAELQNDQEFARRLEAGDSSHAFVDYCTHRGVDVDDAELLGLAYFAGRIHGIAQFDHLVNRVLAAPEKDRL